MTKNISQAEGQQPIIDNMPWAVLIFDDELKLSNWNTRAEAYFDTSLNKLINRSLEEVMCLPSNLSLADLKAQWESEKYASAVCQFSIDSGKHHFHTSFTPLSENGVFQGLMVQFDTESPQSSNGKLSPELDFNPSVLDHIKDAILITEPLLDYPGPRIWYANHAFTTMTGYKADEVIGKTPRILQGPETDTQALASLKSILSRDEYFKSETVNYRKNGEPFLLQWEVTPIKGAANEVRYYMAVQRDITNYKSLKTEAANSEANYQAVLENSGIPMGISQYGTLIYANQALANLLGMSSGEELQGLSFRDFVTPEFTEQAKERQEYLEQYGGELAPAEAAFIHKQGKRVPVSVTGIGCYYLGKLATHFIAHDLSEQKGVEQKLEQQEVQFRQITDNLREAVFLLDADFGFKYASPSTKEILGLSNHQSLYSSLYNYIPPQEKERFQQVHQELLDGRATPQMFYHLKFSTTEVRSIQGYFIPVKDDNNTVTQIQGIARDITGEEKRDNLYKETQEIADVGGWRISKDKLKLTTKLYDILEHPYNHPLNVEEAIQYYDQAHQPLVREALDALWYQGIPFDQEFRIFTRKGHKKWVRVKGRPYYTNDTFYEVGGIVQNITEQKDARKDRDRFYEHSLELLAVVKDGYIIKANKGWEGLLGWSIEELKQYPYEDFVHPDYLAFSREKMQSLAYYWKTDSFINCMVCKDGSYRWVEGYGVYDPEEGLVYSFARDVTEQKESELSLRESQHFNQKITQTFPSLTVIADLTSQCYIYENGRIQTFLGYTLEEVNALEQGIFSLVASSDRTKLQESLSKVLQLADGETLQSEFQLKTRSGEYRWFLITNAPFKRNASGELIQVLGSVQDITEQKETELRLRENQDFIEKVAYTSPSLIAIADYRNLTYVYENGRLQEVLGYTLDEINAKENGLLDLIHPDDISQSEQVLKANLNLKDGEVKQHEFRIMNKEGEYYWVLAKDTPFKRDENGELIQMLISAHDITEQKQREQQLREQEQFIKDITENSPSFINIYDYEIGDYIYENRPILTYLGYEPPYDESRYPYFHPDERDRITASTQANRYLKDGEISTIEYRMQHRDGHYRWFYNQDVVHKRDKASNVKQLLGLITDVTETKEAQASLRRSEAYYRQLFQNTPVGIVTLDMNYQVVNCNAGFTALFGYTQEELEGYVLDDFIVPEAYRYESKTFSDKPAQGETITRETVRLDKEGNHLPVLVYGVPVFYDNEPVNIYGMYIDIADRKKAEDDLRKKTEALLQTNAELEQFAYITSHHLRSPVINLQSLTELFDSSELKDPENQYIFQKVTESVEVLEHTLNDLTYIVGKKDQLSAPKELIRFQTVFEECKALLAEKIEQANAHITADFTAVSGIGYLRTFLSSILCHLLSNALRFRHPEREPVIHLQTFKAGNYTCLSVSDNGLGIDLKKNENRIFELYEGIHKDRSGKGMGLYLVKYQVEALGGYVAVESKVNEGSTFYVYLTDYL